MSARGWLKRRQVAEFGDPGHRRDGAEAPEGDEGFYRMAALPRFQDFFHVGDEPVDSLIFRYRWR